MLGTPDKGVYVFCLTYLQALLMYAAFFFANMGNYKSFGDTKVVPSLGKVPYPHRKTCSCCGCGTTTPTACVHLYVLSMCV